MAASATQAAAAGAPPKAKYSSANNNHTRRRSIGPPREAAPALTLPLKVPALEAAELKARSTRDAANEFACREPMDRIFSKNKNVYKVQIWIRYLLESLVESLSLYN